MLSMGWGDDSGKSLCNLEKLLESPATPPLPNKGGRNTTHLWVRDPSEDPDSRE